MEQFANTPTAVTNNGSTLSSTATSCTVTSQVNIPSSGNFRVLFDSEIVEVTAVSGNTWTISRGNGGTTAATHADGITVYGIVTAEALNALVSIQSNGTETSDRRVLNFIGPAISDNSGDSRCDIDSTGIYNTTTSGSLDFSTGSWQALTLNGSNGTLSTTNIVSNQEFTIELIQNSTGGYTVTWFSTITWVTPTGAAPTIDPAPYGVTVVRFKQTSSGNYLGWLVASTLHYSSLIQSTSGLVGYWQLQETSGTTATDSTGNSNGTYTGTYTLGAFCYPGLGNSVVFDGSSGCVTIPSVSALVATTSLTFEAWFSPISVAGSSYLRVASKNDYELMIGDGNSNFSGGMMFQCIISGSTYAIQAQGPLVSGKWHHIVGTFNGSQMLLYTDGFLAGSLSQSGTLGSTGYALNIARYPNGTSHYMSGSVAHVAVYNTVLTPAQIYAHYHAGTTLPLF